MEWLEIAWAEVGTKEIEGAAHNSAIQQYLIDAGRADIVADETHWCMAFHLACLARAGIPMTLPKEERLLARSALKIGRRCR